MNRLDKLYSTLIIALCFYLPFMSYARAFANIIILCLFFILIINYNKKKLHKILSYDFIKVLIALIAFIFLSSTLKGSISEDFSQITKFSQVAILIVLFCISTRKKTMINAFIIGTLLSSIITCFNIVCHYFNSLDFLLLKSSVINDLFTIERLYLGYYVIVALTLCFHMHETTNKQINKYIYSVLILFFTTCLFLFSSRSAIIILAVIFISYSLKNLKVINLKFAAISVILILGTILLNTKTLAKRFLYSGDETRKSFIEKVKIHEPRYDIWKFSYQIFKENKSYFFGSGPQKIKDDLIDKYDNISIGERRKWFKERQFNTHNQFIDFILSYGAIGLMLFLYFLFKIVLISYKNIHALNLIVGLILFCLIENIFHRQLGVFIFAFIIVWIFHLTELENEKNTSSRLS